MNDSIVWVSFLPTVALFGSNSLEKYPIDDVPLVMDRILYEDVHLHLQQVHLVVFVVVWDD
jgi:hypothetical protein